MSNIAVVRKLLVSGLLFGIVLFVPAAYAYGAGSESASPAGGSSAQAAEAAAQSTAQSPGERKPQLEVTWENSLVTIAAADADLVAVTKALSEKTGVEITLYEGIAGKVTLHEKKAPLEKVVDRLLAAAGQRNYLMVFDGGGLTKMSIVPKSTDGKSMSEAAKKAKVKGILRNGKEIEYYPGEIVVGIKGHFKSPQHTELVARTIHSLEQAHGLLLLKKARVAGNYALKFRVLRDRDILAVMYEILGDSTLISEVAYVSPNGIGLASIEMPEEDFEVFEMRNEDYEAIRTSGISNVRYIMDKFPFLKMGTLDLYPLQRPPVQHLYVDKQLSVHISKTDVQRISYSDVLALAAQQEGIIVGHLRDILAEDYWVLFPGVSGEAEYAAKIMALQEAIAPLRKEETTIVSPVSWSSGNGVPSDSEYLAGLQWNLMKIRAEHGWDIQPACTNTVAVIDTGIHAAHAEFGSRLSDASRDFTESGNTLDDAGSHGTHVSGIFGAQTNNGYGIAGVAGGWYASATAAQVLTLKIQTEGYEPDRVEARKQAILYAIGKAQVINMSWDWYLQPQLVEALDLAYESGLVIVGAAGNYGWTIDDLAHYDFPQGFQDKILVVAATDEIDGRWNDGSGADGKQSNYGAFVSVSAPGRTILSTVNYGSGFDVKSGTSYAAPHVSGLAALLLSQGKTQQEVYALIRSTADQLSFPSQPWDGKMGTGRINAYAALRVAQGYEKDGTSPGKPSNTQLIPGPGNLRVTWTATDNDAVGECLLYRRSSSGVTCPNPETVADAQYCQVALVRSAQPDGTSFEYTDRDLSEGALYSYRIVAVDKTGNRSAPSDELGPVQIHTPAAPTTLTSVTGDASVALSWAAPTTNRDGSPLTDLAGHTISYDTDEPGAPYAGTGAVEGNSPIFVPSTQPSGQMEFLLSGLANDGATVYFIMVRAVDTAGNESADSTWVAVRPLPANWVPGEYGTIQAAITAASAGQVVMVGPKPRGEYYDESYLRLKNGVEVRSEAGPDWTLIWPQNRAPVVIDGTSGGTITGFTIKNGTYGVNLSMDNGLVVRNNVITANRVGIYIGGVDRASHVVNNTIVANETKGLNITTYGNATIANNILVGKNNNDYGVYNFNGNPFLAYNDVWGFAVNYYGNMLPGEGSFSADPQFIDPAVGDLSDRWLIRELARAAWS